MTIKKLLLSAAVAAGALVATGNSASAAVVCNRFGDCWHTTSRYDYHPSWGITVRDNNWRWDRRDNQRYRWREHAGRGYWRSGAWVTF